MTGIRSVLLAIDLYDNYQLLLNRGVQIARQHNASLHVVHVMPLVLTTLPYAYNFQSDMEAETTSKLNVIKTEFDGLHIVTHLLKGTAKNEITKLAAELNIDLIVLGSHGKHGIDLLLGSTANGVLHLSDRNVFTIHLDEQGNPSTTGQYQRILIATDLHEDNKVVVDTANVLAKEYSASLYAIHVVPDAAIVSSMYVPQLEIDLRTEAKPRLEKLMQSVNVPCEHSKVIMGHPKIEILHYAKEIKADLIVIGSHGRKGLSSVLLGSTANAVLHGATTDVFVARIK